MIDLQGIARHLRLSVEQLRIAADLLQQGYHPAFIERYRADETGSLPRQALWTLKLEIDRQQRLAAARQKAKDQLPKDAELDEEALKYLERASTEVEIEATLKAFRARRALQQSQERDSQAGHLLEMLIAYDGAKIDDVEQWVSDQLGVDKTTGTQALQQTARLISSLVQCDTPLNERLRRAIQRKATVRVELCDSNTDEHPPVESKKLKGKSVKPSAEAASPTTEPSAHVEPTESTAAVGACNAEVTNSTGDSGSETASSEAGATTELAVTDVITVEIVEAAVTSNEVIDCAVEIVVASTHETSANATEPTTTSEISAVGADGESGGETLEQDEHAQDDMSHDEHDEMDDQAHDDHGHEDDSTGSAESPSGAQSRSSKSKKNAKMTPRQRRRRWLISMLQPMKTLKRPLTQLTAYQQLMLGRGRRSQLVKTHLEYDVQSLVPMARDAFVSDKHPLSKWFEEAVKQALENTTRVKIEADAVADLEEIAQEKLLESSADQLRQHLMRRPVRGHTIMLVDTVGPKLAAVVVVNPQGDVLAIEELPCSAQAETVNQNVVKLGELAHKFRVTLVALTNGPARRFLVLTVRELMKQSASSGLRWTMADRGGAEAYAAGRTALKELSAYNRRDRAAIWIARSLQNPLAELLKVDINRMRLGSYQRELPQEPLKKLVQEVIADCVCSRGIDTHHASLNELLFIPGIQEAQARQITEIASSGKLESRAQLCASVSDWPDVQSRQAIGWLRVFGSEQPLDATAIHPDDYRLAQRLIDNTEFTAPPNAPENWVKRVSLATAAAATSESSEPSGTSAEPEADATSTAEIGSESSSGEVTSSADTTETNAVPASEGATSNETAADATTDSPAASEPTSEVAASEAVTDQVEAGQAEDAVNPAALDETAMSFKSPSAAQASVEPAVKPEYPEDVLPTTVAAGPDIDVEKLARGWQVGREKLRWIASCLNEPFADSRLAGTPIPLRTDMPTLAALEPGMCVWAVVVGVADFGAFVELSPDCSGLIHISRLSAAYVEDPHQSVQVGDLLLTWVVATDEKKNRVALTALSPAERAAAEALLQERREQQREAAAENRGRGQRRGDRPAAAAATGQAPATAGSERSRGGQRPANAGGRPQGSGGGRQGQGHAQGGRPSHGGGQGGHGQGGRGRGRGAGGGGPRPAKTVVVTSKKPKAPISEAMKEGDEPLRSFSDLLQFYEAKRTDEPPTPPAEG